MPMGALLRRSFAAADVTSAPPLLKLALSRFYLTSGAAQPQFDPEYWGYSSNGYGSYSETHGDCVGSLPVADTDFSVTRGRVQWAFIGCPLAKKRVYAQTISRILQVPYISMAILVSQELNPRSAMYRQIANAVNRGECVPEDIIFGLLSKRLEEGYYRGETGFILDGIPRTRLQAEILDELAEIDLVVNFKCSEDYLRKSQQGPWKDKLKEHFEQTKPLEAYYQKEKRLIDFQVSTAPRDTWRELLSALHLQELNAVYSSNKKLVVTPPFLC
ncbi:Probable adenylate kinase 7, mitochondrial [Linum perenne]